MITINIDEELLRQTVLEDINSDEELHVSEKFINEKIEEVIACLLESPEEIISGLIIDDIILEALDEEDEEDEGEDIREEK